MMPDQQLHNALSLNRFSSANSMLFYSRNLTKLLKSIPGEKTFGIYRFLPAFFVLGAALEFSMINWTVGETNFCKSFPKTLSGDILFADSEILLPQIAHSNDVKLRISSNIICITLPHPRRLSKRLVLLIEDAGRSWLGSIYQVYRGCFLNHVSWIADGSHLLQTVERFECLC